MLIFIFSKLLAQIVNKFLQYFEFCSQKLNEKKQIVKDRGKNSELKSSNKKSEQWSL